MWTPQWRLAPILAVTCAAFLGAATAHGGTVRDEAAMFSKDAVAKADATIAKIQHELKFDVTIETVTSLKGQEIATEALQRAKQGGETGLYVLIAKDEHKIWVLASDAYRRALDPRETKISRAFMNEFKNRDFDGGLLKGVQTIGAEASSAKAEFGTLRQGGQPGVRVNNGMPARGMPRRGRGGFGLGSLLMIGLGLMAVMFVIRTIGALFSRGQGYGQQGPMMGRPGYGGGYGGGGGGGFMSGLFGGIGGALAGNWLYDQFSGRHQGGGYGGDTTGAEAGNTGEAPTSDGWGNDAGAGGDWGGGGDVGGAGGDWGGGGGGDWGGGGGGGDW